MLDTSRFEASQANRLLTAITLGIFAVMIAVIGLQMLARWVLGPLFGMYLPWTSSLSRLLLIFLTFVGAAIASRDREHVTVNLLIKHLPPWAARALVIVQSLLIGVFLVVLLVGAVAMYHLTAGRTFGALPTYPLLTNEWLYIAVLVGSALMLAYILRDLVSTLVGDEVPVPSEGER
ncbi:TRAP transporter small permease subunit [Natrinema sp. SYSU A 869]|uniref:TRAP transporter small permease n=1 Tax=Natrinema sp. SYSU A 869 TaxID=2871694 RepID=UPI001CA3DC90|nr:TRAP transporter small permease subunit [Natrinema sp. SYSU A 869]